MTVYEIRYNKLHKKKIKNCLETNWKRMPQFYEHYLIGVLNKTLYKFN